METIISLRKEEIRTGRAIPASCMSHVLRDLVAPFVEFSQPPRPNPRSSPPSYLHDALRRLNLQGIRSLAKIEALLEEEAQLRDEAVPPDELTQKSSSISEDDRQLYANSRESLVWREKLLGYGLTEEELTGPHCFRIASKQLSLKTSATLRQLPVSAKKSYQNGADRARHLWSRHYFSDDPHRVLIGAWLADIKGRWQVFTGQGKEAPYHYARKQTGEDFAGVLGYYCDKCLEDEDINEPCLIPYVEAVPLIWDFSEAEGQQEDLLAAWGYILDAAASYEYRSKFKGAEAEGRRQDVDAIKQLHSDLKKHLADTQ